MKFAIHLRALIAVATGAPWKVSHDGRVKCNNISYMIHGIYDKLIVYGQIEERDAKLIAYLANHASAIAAVVESVSKPGMCMSDDGQYVSLTSKDWHEIVAAVEALHVGQTGE